MINYKRIWNSPEEVSLLTNGQEDQAEIDPYTDEKRYVAQIVAQTAGIDTNTVIDNTGLNPTPTFTSRLKYYLGYGEMVNWHPFVREGIAQATKDSLENIIREPKQYHHIAESFYLPAVLQAIYWDIYISKYKGTEFDTRIEETERVNPAVLDYFRYLPINYYFEKSPHLVMALIKQEGVRKALDQSELHPFATEYSERAHKFTEYLCRALDGILSSCFEYGYNYSKQLLSRPEKGEDGYNLLKKYNYQRSITHLLGGFLRNKLKYGQESPFISRVFPLSSRGLTADRTSGSPYRAAKELSMTVREIQTRNEEALRILTLFEDDTHLAYFCAFLNRSTNLEVRMDEIKELLDRVRTVLSSPQMR